MREGDALSLSKGWKEVTLEDIAEYGKEKIIYSKVDSSNFISADNMFPEIGGITNSDYTPTKGNISKYETGDILLSNIRPYFKKMWFADFDGGCSNDVLVLKTKSGEVNSKFLFYNLSQQEFFDFIMAGANGVKMPRGNKNALIKFKIKLPPLETQRKIATILSGYDDLIENNLKRIKILEEMAQQTYEEWFVRMRFPGYETAVMNEETGLPEGWEKNVLKSFCTKITKGTTPTSLGEKFVEEGVKFIKAESYTDEGCFIEKKFAYIDEETHELLGRSKLERNDILVSIAGVLGRVAMVNEYILPANTNQAVGIVRINSELTSPYFIKYFLNSKRTNILINTVSGQAAQPNINLAQLGSLEILTPHKIIVEKFHDIIEVRDKLQIKLHRQNQSLREARDLLLPRLMMGIVEV